MQCSRLLSYGRSSRSRGPTQPRARGRSRGPQLAQALSRPGQRPADWLLRIADDVLRLVCIPQDSTPPTGHTPSKPAVPASALSAACRPCFSLHAGVVLSRSAHAGCWQRSRHHGMTACCSSQAAPAWLWRSSCAAAPSQHPSSSFTSRLFPPLGPCCPHLAAPRQRTSSQQRHAPRRRSSCLHPAAHTFCWRLSWPRPPWARLRAGASLPSTAAPQVATAPAAAVQASSDVAVAWPFSCTASAAVHSLWPHADPHHRSLCDAAAGSEYMHGYYTARQRVALSCDCAKQG